MPARFRSIGRAAAADSNVLAAPGISVKLSALCPRFELAQTARAVAELGERLLALARSSRARPASR